MVMNNKTLATGGCQCGAVRYAIDGPFMNPHICHCRMCQKAFGNYFAALVAVQRKDLHWTKGEPALFRSSSVVARGFCHDCGTPLSYAHDNSERTLISIGSLDHPEALTLLKQFGIEGRLPAFFQLQDLPGIRTEDFFPPEKMAELASRQHPDRD
jgi:hypothetical protein